MKVIVINSTPINPIVIGRIKGAYGILGWVKILSFTEKIEDIFVYNPWFIFFRSKWKVIKLEYWRLMNNKNYIVKFFNVSDRNHAMALSQHNLVVESIQFPKLYNKDEYYWKDIIGCKIMTINGKCLGRVISIIDTKAHDILVVRSEEYGFTKYVDCLIPFILKKIIKDVDLIKNIVVVDWEIYKF
ncbi:16S rRNA processing protein [Candidatus Blochmanniella floridana]|uniref:Ribosome maturation factor RimM n=1 Tax=Blochmanniella floridana TaxID=203907 RepID=RIMM_BLOFL|nr:RecName: Full=Ribosome maturation factor RimM [Candidatus Blochmannia floridanus]CAD83693.1 16S rRNA processing protein [Candidatus Blochmannia floridanus]